MRKFKFRMWDKSRKCMNDFPTHEFLICNNSYFSEKYVMMQYTGLEDVNSKEIYEGDIVKITHPSPLYSTSGIYEVIFENGKFGMKGFDTNDFHSRHKEIIGNIYENPELLG